MIMLKLVLAFTLLFNFAYAEQKDLSAPEASLMKKEALRLWAKRDDQQSLEESLSKFEHALAGNPKDLEALTYLARGHFTLGELHQTNDDLKKRSFEKARTFGTIGLNTNPEYKKLAEDDIETAISKITEKEVGILYWTAASLGKWAKLNGVMSSLKFKSEILAMIKQVEKLKPDFFHGAVPRYWGGFYAIAPSIAGGDMKKSKKNFDRAMAVAPEYLANKTLYAEAYLVKEEDKKEFMKVLQEVLKAPNGPEDIVPENMLEKKKAERLMDKADELFD
jgi:tetratricopeptide (TPR) repeat protein